METTTALLPILALIVLPVIVMLASAREIPENTALVIFRLGKLVGVQRTGRRVLIPLIDQGIWIDLRPLTDGVPNIELTLREREYARVNLHYTYRIVDPAACATQVPNFALAIAKLLQNTLKTLAEQETLDDLEANPSALAKKLIARTKTALSGWGIELQRVSLEQLPLAVDE